jgi:protein O-mannosyl-transferase
LTSARVLLCAALLVVTFVAYWPLHDAGFVNYDDPLYVTANPNVQRGLSFGDIVWAFSTDETGNWIPLTWLSHQAVVSLGGLDPRWHHLANLLLHAANALILFLLLEQATGEPWPSALGAFLFALHPLHVESVAWVSERKDVLSTCFGLLAIAAYVARVARGQRGSSIVVGLLFACSLMTKAMFVTLPALLLLLDWWPLRRVSPDSVATLLREKLPLAGVAAVAALAVIATQHHQVSATPFDTLPLSHRLAHTALSYVRYLQQAVWPTRLAVFYPYPHVIDWAGAAGATVLLLAITAFAFAARVRAPYVLVGWLWFVVSLLPVIGIVQVGMQSTADRYMYVPLIGLAITLAWGLDAIVRAAPRSLVPVVALVAVIVSACAIGTTRQARYWHDDIVLYRHALAVTSDNFLVHNNLGSALMARGESGRPEAAVHFTEALRLRAAYPEAHNNLGGVLYLEGRNAEAIAQFTEAIRLQPGFTAARNNLRMAQAAAGTPP